MSVDSLSTIAPDVARAVADGRRLERDSVRALAAVSDILSLGALADDVRRRRFGASATYVRVHELDLARPDDWTPPPPSAREVRLRGVAGDLASMVAAVTRARDLAGACVLRGYTLDDVVGAGSDPTATARALVAAGLDEVAWVDPGGDAAATIAVVRGGGLGVRVVGSETAPVDRAGWLLDVRALQDAVGGLAAVAPLPRVQNAALPTTGFDDVRAVALARLTIDGHLSIQVDWMRYGPKLAQVALTVGADDLDMVSADDDLSKGTRRAPLEDVRRNIAAAGLVAVERDGRHTHVGA
jgi:hypothetical protein